MAVDPSIFRRELSLGDLFPDATPEEWRRLAVASLKGAPFEVLQSNTHEGITIDPLYTAGDGTESRVPLGRGPGPWLVCQRYCHPDPAAVSSRLSEDASRGAGAAWVVFDQAVRLGAKLEDPESVGPCDGTVAVVVDQIEQIIDGIDPARTAVHLYAGGNGFAIAAAAIAAGSRRGQELDFRFDLDPLAALVTDGRLPYGLDRSLSLLPDIASWTTLNAPGSRSLAASTLPYHSAGAHAVQELAYALATAVEYLRHLDTGGVDLQAAFSQLRFVFGIGRDFFMEAAKLRAARRLWQRVVAACGVPEEEARTEIHAVTSPRCLAARDPWVNLLRTTSQSCAAVIGGADSLSILPFDGAAGPPNELALRIAANTHAILRDESHLHRVTDPAAGSWYVERLTNQLTEGAWSRFQQIESLGGMTAAITSGVIHQELEQTLESKRAAVATRRDPVTGVSVFPNLDEEPLPRPAPDVRALRKGIQESLADRSSPRAELDRLLSAADSNVRDGVVTAAAIDALTAGATIAEAAEALRGEGEPTRCEALPSGREGEIFERLRDAGDAFRSEIGRRPQAFLATIGPPGETRGLRELVVNLLAAGGIQTVSSDAGEDPESIASDFETRVTRTAVIVAAPSRAEDVVPALARELKTRDALRVLVAARPSESEGAWRAAGVDGFLYRGCDVYETLRDVLGAAGWFS